MKTKRNILTLCLLPLLLVAVTADAASEIALSRVGSQRSSREVNEYYGRRIAICIGINEYTALQNLNCAVNDAVEMASVFEAYGFDEVVLLTNEEATRETVLGELQRLRDGASEDDLFVFFFAGHGLTLRKGQDLTGVLVPADCRKGYEAQDGISMAYLKQISDEMACRQSLFLVDACYSGYGLAGQSSVSTRARRGKVSESTLKQMTSRPSVQILTAGGEQDRAFESDGHGLFTRSVLQCLRGESPEGRDGVVLGRELANKVRSSVREETGGWQTPQFGCDGDGDIVFTMGRKLAASSVAMAR